MTKTKQPMTKQELIDKAVEVFKSGLFDTANIDPQSFDDKISASFRACLVRFLADYRAMCPTHTTNPAVAKLVEAVKKVMDHLDGIARTTMCDAIAGGFVADTLRTALAAMPEAEKCVWTYDEYNDRYNTTCGRA